MGTASVASEVLTGECSTITIVGDDHKPGIPSAARESIRDQQLEGEYTRFFSPEASYDPWNKYRTRVLTPLRNPYNRLVFRNYTFAWANQELKNIFK
jgi:hypothetical protein